MKLKLQYAFHLFICSKRPRFLSHIILSKMTLQFWELNRSSQVQLNLSRQYALDQKCLSSKCLRYIMLFLLNQIARDVLLRNLTIIIGTINMGRKIWLLNLGSISAEYFLLDLDSRNEICQTTYCRYDYLLNLSYKLYTRFDM